MHCHNAQIDTERRSTLKVAERKLPLIRDRSNFIQTQRIKVYKAFWNSTFLKISSKVTERKKKKKRAIL